MRQSIGGTWLLQLMIVFILLFVAYIVLMINYSKVVKAKNEVLSMIEKYDGLNEQSIELVNNYLLYAGYDMTSTCTADIGVYGATSLSDNKLEYAQNGKKYYYCVKKYEGAHSTNYYQISLFYKFNIPILGDFSSFAIKGTTTNFQSHDDSLYANIVS